MSHGIHTSIVQGTAPRIHARLPLLSEIGQFLRPAAIFLAGGTVAAAAWASFLLVPDAIAMDGLAALVGTGALLYLGLAALSTRIGAGLCNLAAFAGILTWAVLAPTALWALAAGLLLHASACGWNAWLAGKAIAVRRELPLGLGVSSLALGVMILTAGI